MVGKTNEFAYAAARKVAGSRNVSFNPLFLYSGVGLGKTHLMHAIAAYQTAGSEPQYRLSFRRKIYV